MIARQRDNLRRTFAQAEESTADAHVLHKLATTERELADATAEFTEGIEQRAGPVPCLHEAQDAMRTAAEALERKDPRAASGPEETALAGLIQARQNLRKFLSESQSCSTSCRKFDQEQKQKLRKPPAKDRKAQLAKLQEEIEKLAREEKKFSEEVAPKSGGAQLEKKDAEPQQKPQSSKSAKGSPSSSSSNGQKPAESAGSAAERQEKAAEKAEELRKLVQEDEALTELARERMDKAAEDVQGSAKSMREGQPREAGDKAAEAAEELERLARQVAGLKAADLMTRVGQSESLACQLAKQQERLGKELQEKGDNPEAKKPGAGRGRADDERRLAEEARTLADLLEKLQKDAAGKNPDLGRQLREATEANSPKDAAEQMGRAAEALKAGKPGQARRDVDESAHNLDALGQQLSEARHGLAGPQLDKLMALEKQAAETQQALESANSERQKGEAEKKVTDLREALDALQPADPKVTEAAAALRQAGTWTKRVEPHDPRLGAYVPPIEYTEGVPRTVKVLQAKIQEIILKDALLDKDEAVPPQFKKLVEEYYRVLSEDLR